MTRPAIIINEFDAERIDRLLEQPAYANSPVADAPPGNSQWMEVPTFSPSSAAPTGARTES